jgi:integrase
MHQDGYIWRKGRSWYGRWRDDVYENGQVVRKQRSEKLAEYSDRYRTESDVRPLLEAILRPLNEGKARPEGTLPVAQFVEGYYLPFANENCKPSTYVAYKTQWDSYLAPRLRDIPLRDFRTMHAANILADIHRTHGLSRSTLRHLKAFLSVVFTFAKNLGVLDGVNPVQDAMIPRKAAPPQETYAATPDEVLGMLDALAKAPLSLREAKQAQAAVALMFFAGLRPGEARGARWENFDGKRLIVRQSVWRTYATEPKTFESSKPIPIIEPLRSILAELCVLDGNPADGPILRGPKGKPLNLDNLAKRKVRPVITAAGLRWHGWYALRRGIATLVNAVEKDAMAAKGLLRHASVTTTQKHYIKEGPAITLSAMEKVETLCTDRATAAANRPN